jgi:hypothetical protein
MAEGGISPDLQAILDSMGENTEMGLEAMLAATEMGGQYALEQQKRQQGFLDKASEQAIGYYQPFLEGGMEWGRKAARQIEGGPPKYNWDKEFSYDPWSWDKKFEHQKWDEYSKDRFTDEGIKKSPYYGLYQYQKEQQDQAMNKNLRSRGLYNSGAGMKQAMNAQSGIDEGFVAGEYNRARGEYATDYEQALNDYTRGYNEKLQQHNIGYEEAKQKYGMSYDQYNKTFGVNQGQWTDELNTNLGLFDYAWKGAQGMANARIGQGNQLGTGAIQTGQTLAGLQSNLASGIGSAYNAQGNQMASLYNNAANNATTMAGINAGQSNWNTANTTNQWAAGAATAAGVGRNLWDAYRYYNSPSTSTGGGSGPVSSPYDYGFGGGDTGNYWDTGEGSYW